MVNNTPDHLTWVDNIKYACNESLICVQTVCSGLLVQLFSIHSALDVTSDYSVIMAF